LIGGPVELAPILGQYRDQLLADPRFQRVATFAEQKQALWSITSCRTLACGEIKVYCPQCRQYAWFFHSCGHRSCPRCQHHETSRWLRRQIQKLLPVDYFLVTFTLPAQLRALARTFPQTVFNLMFWAAAHTLQNAALNPKYFGGLIGFTGVLHTHSRRLDFHPHIHFIVPGLAFRSQTGICVHTRNPYLIPEQVLGSLFKGKLLSGLKELGYYFNTALYRIEWVVDCEFSGRGESALKYLSRYLYRGVISEKNILSHHNRKVSFRYQDRATGNWLIRTLDGIEFARLLLQHTLPKSFRRVRDYGFLHGNAKKTLARIQLLLKPKLKDQPPSQRPAFKCPCCGNPVVIIAIGVFRTRVLTRNRSPPQVTHQAFMLD